MHERRPEKEYDNRWKAAVDISTKAFEVIDKRFSLRQEGAVTPREYHNIIHTMQVHEVALLIAMQLFRQNKIDKNDLPLISIAASYHDIVQGRASGENERLSAAEAVEAMEKSGIFTSKDMDKVTKMIMATRIRFEDGNMLQSAGEDILEHIIADADLAHLGLPFDEYIKRANALLHEFYGLSPTAEQKSGFLVDSYQLLNNHTFYTQEAADLFPNQKSNAGLIIGQSNVF